MKTNPLTLILAALVSLSIISCRSTTLTATWADQSYQQRPIHSVLVIGISQDQAARRQFEDTFVAQLEKQNVEAVAGYTQISSPEKLDQQAIDKAVQSAGTSTVLITHVVGVEERTQYNPPARTYYPAPYHRGMYGYYSRAYDEVYTPGYYTSYEVYELETNLYDGSTGKLIWSARSETVDPKNASKVIDSLVKLLIKDLRKNNLI
jgi:hypothetical protein